MRAGQTIPTARCDRDPTVLVGHVAHPAKRRLDVLDLRREDGLLTEPVIDADHREPPFGEMPREVGTQAPVSKTPRAAVQPDDHGATHGDRVWKIQVGVRGCPAGEANSRSATTVTVDVAPSVTPVWASRLAAAPVVVRQV